ncbi:hypothetical protein cgp_0907 [Corynebacterium glutamicum MB001]|nr:hypothetical protein cgp_0907 [Corynebacterium glutamicum MB001]ASW13500.1 hypothetical protein cgc1_0907 [Corynebacterium glutamicum]QYO73031.1 hypothetical protein cgisf_0907 [Corynebacterium glutamicum]CAF19502.1 hypothetical protein cg0907 [Corynebacterium glutamicum ATCC 13032]
MRVSWSVIPRQLEPPLSEPETSRDNGIERQLIHAEFRDLQPVAIVHLTMCLVYELIKLRPLCIPDSTFVVIRCYFELEVDLIYQGESQTTLYLSLLMGATKTEL